MTAYEWKIAYQRADEIVAAVDEARRGRSAPPSFIDVVGPKAEHVVAEMLVKWIEEDQR